MTIRFITFLGKTLETLQHDAYKERQQRQISENNAKDAVQFGNPLHFLTVNPVDSDEHIHDRIPVFALDQYVDRDEGEPDVIKVFSRVLRVDIRGAWLNEIPIFIHDSRVREQLHAEQGPNEEEQEEQDAEAADVLETVPRLQNQLAHACIILRKFKESDRSQRLEQSNDDHRIGFLPKD